MTKTVRMADPVFSCSAREFDNALHLTFHGELDLNSAAQCGVDLQQPLAGAHESILLDLSEVTFVDSSGLKLLVNLKEQAELGNREFLLTGVPPAVARLFEITGLTKFFSYLDV